MAKESTKKPARRTKKQSPADKQPQKWARPFRAVGGYFKGAWEELRLVHWPNRSATWGLTVAVIMFSLFFAGMILGLDTAFSYLFKEILL